MTEPTHKHDDRAHGAQLRRREMRDYVGGAGAALVLTLASFAAVYWHVLARPGIYYLIGVLALAQMVVHFRGFLHISLRHKREDLQLILFSLVLLVLIVGGTLWIMFNLSTRMAMPGS
jgi:cytochrome o ubiquinol oxidase operon protein cyoD